jgi:hypothetical protein
MEGEEGKMLGGTKEATWEEGGAWEVREKRSSEHEQRRNGRDLGEEGKRDWGRTMGADWGRKRAARWEETGEAAPALFVIFPVWSSRSRGCGKRRNWA